MQQQQKTKWKTWHKVTIAILLLIIILFGKFVSKQEDIGEQKYQQSLTQLQKDSITRVTRIRKGFSEWDGSNKNLVLAVKKNMNDPNSFEHVETKYWDVGENTIVVMMTYRGKNAFGGVVTESVKVETDVDGNMTKTFQK